MPKQLSFNKKRALQLLAFFVCAGVAFHCILPNNAVDKARYFMNIEPAGFVVPKSVVEWTFNEEEDSENHHAYNHKWVGFSHIDPDVNCTKAFAGGVKNIDYNNTVNTTFPYQYTDLSQNCSAFRSTLGFQRYPRPTAEELEFPLAFSIIFHKDLDQVVFLLRAIYHPHNTYCLHPDAKVSVEFLQAVQAVAECLPGVFVASKLQNIHYEGYSRLQADINCMTDLVHSNVQWKYFMNLPGQEFPLRTNLEMVRILKLFNGSNDIEGIVRFKMSERYQFKWAEERNQTSGDVLKVRVGGRNPPPPHNFTVVKGSAYGTFSRAFVEYIIHDQEARDLLEWSRAVLSPDEYYWATLHHSGRVPGGFMGDPEKKTWLSAYTLWLGTRKCSHFVRYICIFGIENINFLATLPNFFANKFHISYKPAGLHCMDQWLFDRTVAKDVRDLDYYKHTHVARGH